MKKPVMFLVMLAFSVMAARAYEFHLQFTPPAGSIYVYVAGFRFVDKKVIGPCNYSVAHAGSGRGSHPSITEYDGKCTWDFYGNLISQEEGSLAAPRIVRRSGTELIYANDGKSTTGRDERGFGFVRTPSAHYSWESALEEHIDISNKSYTFTADLISDGDFPLFFEKPLVDLHITGSTTSTAGRVVIDGTSCHGSLWVGSRCSVTLTYDPATIRCSSSPYGLAYTSLDLWALTNARVNVVLNRKFTVSGVPICGD